MLHLYVESKKNVQMSLFAKEKESHRCRNKLMVARGKVEGGDKLEIGNDIYTLPYLK